MTKTKLHPNDLERACGLLSKLHDADIRAWFSVVQNDQSNCQWWIGKSKIHSGGIGVLLRALQEACFAHGIMKRAPHISNRNPVRLAVDSTPVWTTSNGG